MLKSASNADHRRVSDRRVHRLVDCVRPIGRDVRPGKQKRGLPPLRKIQNHRHAGLAHRLHHPSATTASATRSEIRRSDQGKGVGVDGLVASARRTAQGCAQRAADHDGRRRLQPPGNVRWRRPDSGLGSHREERPALHQFPLHLALLPLALVHYHRPQPSLERLRRGGRDRDGVPGLRLDHPEGERHHR